MKKPAILIFSFLLITGSLYAQGSYDMDSIPEDSVIYRTKFRITPGADIEYATPQKYGAGAGLYIGRYSRKMEFYDRNLIKNFYFFKGINPHVRITRGGYQLGLYYFDMVSFIAPAGVKIGPVYYSNNSYSSVFKRNELIGIEAEYYLIFKIKAGVLKEINGSRFLPVLGFGFPIGPAMYKGF